MARRLVTSPGRRLDAESHCAFIWKVEAIDSLALGSSVKRPYQGMASDLQLFRKTREDSTTCLSDNNHVFQAHAAHPGVIQTRFDGEHLPIL